MEPLISIIKDGKFYVAYYQGTQVTKQQSLLKATQKLAAFIKGHPNLV